jgi:uncharacterized membrane protein
VNQLLICALIGVIWTALFIVIALWRIPSFITKVYVKGLGRRIGADPWNRMSEPTLAQPGPGGVVMASPDMVNMLGAFDASLGPVHIHWRVPDWDTYWSISLFASNTDNFYVLNDRGAKSKDVDLVVTAPGAVYRKQGNEEVIAAPTARGVVVARIVVKNRDDAAEVARAEELMAQTKIALNSVSAAGD